MHRTLDILANLRLRLRQTRPFEERQVDSPMTIIMVQRPEWLL